MTYSSKDLDHETISNGHRGIDIFGYTGVSSQGFGLQIQVRTYVAVACSLFISITYAVWISPPCQYTADSLFFWVIIKILLRIRETEDEDRRRTKKKAYVDAYSDNPLAPCWPPMPKSHEVEDCVSRNAAA